MNRPTIADLAQAAGVSTSTVNRILGGAGSVRPATIQRVQDAANQIGFYGLGAIEARKEKALPRYRLGFLLQQSTRELYQLLAKEIRRASEERQTERVDAVVEFADDLEPDNVAARLLALGRNCDAVAVIAGDHPLVGQTIETLKQRGTPVVAYITDQSAPTRAGYVGTDNWKLGRTAAWFIAQTTHGPGRAAVLIGNHRYQCQDVSEASFRSYMREHADRLTVEDARPTHENPEVARELVATLLAERQDLVGIYVAGGGISGVLTALRDLPPERRQNIRVVCRDIGPFTRQGLAEGLITAALCHPLKPVSDQLVQTMIDVMGRKNGSVILQRTLPFEIITPESV